MLFTRTLLSIIGVTSMLVSVHAAPIMKTSTDILFDQHILIDSMSEYYEGIVDQIMLDVTEDVLLYLPQKMSNGNVEVRKLAQKSMDRNLNFMRASLMASVTPLVSTDIAQIPGLMTAAQMAMEFIAADLEENKGVSEKTARLENELLDAVLILNKKMSHQLGLIVNAKSSSEILIRQISKLPHRVEPTVVTVEWKLRQPFQINIMREEKEETNDNFLSESDWLLSRLAEVEANMFNEFNDHAQEAIELLMEHIALKIVV